MRKPKKKLAERAEPDAGFDRRWAWTAAVSAVLLTPLVVSLSSGDPFRFPKELVLRASGLVIGLTIVLGAIWNDRPAIRTFNWRRRTDALVILIILWTVATAVLSTNRKLSMLTVLWVICAALIFVGVAASGQSKSIVVLAIGMVPAVLNAALCVLQEFRIWNPVIPLETLFNEAGEKLTGLRGTVGLLGNPNDVGTYLLPTLVCAVAACLTDRQRRALWGIVAAAAFIGIIVSQSLASFVATGAVAIALVFLVAGRLRWILLATLVGSLVASAFLVPPIRQRVVRFKQLVQARDYDTIVSGRLLGSVTAWEMFKQRPLIGAGPGTFGYHFFDTSIAVRQRSPALFQHREPIPNYGEAHNDHLQVLATTGLPGYVLMVAAVVLVGSRSFVTPRDDDDRARFARFASLPLAAGFAVSALAQFPMELAAPLTAYLFYSALCLTWSGQATLSES